VLWAATPGAPPWLDKALLHSTLLLCDLSFFRLNQTKQIATGAAAKALSNQPIDKETTITKDRKNGWTLFRHHQLSKRP